MSRPTHALTPKILIWLLAALFLIRGLLILFATDSSHEWDNLLGIGGLATTDAQVGTPSWFLRVIQLIEGRLWVLLAFPLFLRLPWGRDLAMLVAAVGVIIQLFRLQAGNGMSAILWLVIYAGIVALFYTQWGIRTYFNHSQASDVNL